MTTLLSSGCFVSLLYLRTKRITDSVSETEHFESEWESIQNRIAMSVIHWNLSRRIVVTRSLHSVLNYSTHFFPLLFVLPLAMLHCAIHAKQQRQNSYEKVNKKKSNKLLLNCEYYVGVICQKCRSPKEFNAILRCKTICTTLQTDLFSFYCSRQHINAITMISDWSVIVFARALCMWWGLVLFIAHLNA